MNEEILKRTQDTLGKIIGKKPPLTEKLLNRPPFRFLHDVLTSVMRQTGFMKGLFTENESSAETIGSKEEKIAFLQKAIDIVVLVTGTKLSVKPSKIVAGLEAEKTNEFLQALASACNKKSDNESAVKQILGGSVGDKPASKSKDSRSSKDRNNENEWSGSADKRRHRDNQDKIDSSKEKSKGKDSKELPERRREKDSDRKHRDGRRRESSKDGRHRELSSDGRREPSSDGRRESSSDGRRRESSSDRRRRESSKHEEKLNEKTDDRRSRGGEEKVELNNNDEKETEGQVQGEEALDNDEEPQANRIPRPSSAKGSRRRHREGRRAAPETEDDDEAMRHADRKKQEPEEDDMTDALPPQVADARRMARPSSARPAPPKVKRQNPVQAPIERVDSGKRVENLIVDDGDDEEDETFMVEEGAPQENPSIEREHTSAPVEDDGQHGGLVKKILESKKEFDTTQTQNKTKIEKSSAVSDATRHKEREMVRKEVDKLRGSIQTLTRSANPLGKIMDYVQEDLHSMQKEKDMWKAESRKLQDQIHLELSVTDTSIEPLKAQLAELEQAIADQLDLIAAVKHNVIRNDDKMNKMLSSIARS